MESNRATSNREIDRALRHAFVGRQEYNRERIIAGAEIGINIVSGGHHEIIPGEIR